MLLFFCDYLCFTDLVCELILYTNNYMRLAMEYQAFAKNCDPAFLCYSVSVLLFEYNSYNLRETNLGIHGIILIHECRMKGIYHGKGNY